MADKINYGDNWRVAREKINNIMDEVEAHIPSIWANNHWYLWETDTWVNATWPQWVQWPAWPQWPTWPQWKDWLPWQPWKDWEDWEPWKDWEPWQPWKDWKDWEDWYTPVKWVDYFTEEDIQSLNIPTTASDVDALPDSTKYWASISLSINSSTYVITAQLKDQDWNNLWSSQTIDLPLESVVVGWSYDDQTKKVILTLESGDTVEFSVADLVDWLQSEITSQNKLDSDLVDDTNSSNKFVSSAEKSAWSWKQDAIADLNDIRSWASAWATAMQPWDDISDLNNDSWYITSSYHDATKQDVLTAGTNISIENNVISATWWSGDVLVSTQANNIFTSWMKIWWGTEADYLLLTPDSNTAYLLTAGSPTPPSPWQDWDTITGFTYDNKTLSVSQSTYWDVNWMAWKPDGTKFYITWENNNTVYQFSCSTAWDITTGTYDNKSVSTTLSVSVSLWFSDDGLTLWIAWGWSDGYVYKWTLSTAWDVSTATYVWDATGKSNASFYECSGYCMADDWNYLYVLSRGSNRIRRYTMSTPYDVTTLQTWAGDYQEYTPTSTYNHKVILNPQWTQLFYYARNDKQIHICALSTPFDLTTISETSQYTVTTPDSPNITSVAIDNEWNSMYLGWWSLNNIYQYSTTTA